MTAIVPPIVPVEAHEIPRRSTGERPMDLFDLIQRPRALPVLAAMSAKGRPFTDRAFVAATRHRNPYTAYDVAQEMAGWGLLTMTTTHHARVFSLTNGGARIAKLAEEMQLLLLESPIRFHGDNRVPSRTT
jgi:hypothetical protein